MRGGCWVTSWARNNLQECIIKNDSFCAYCDTDSTKLIKGYDKSVIDNYNIEVEKRLKEISQKLSIPFEKFAPKDVYGESHLIGVFDLDGHYEEFRTQGAKKYCYSKIKKLKKLKETDKIIKKIDSENVKVLNITLAGTPKTGVHALQSIDDFKDNFVFDYKYTNKLLLGYIDEQSENIMCDYLGNTYKVTDKTGICLLPTTYTLDKSVEYAELVSDSSSKRAVYKE